MGFFMQDIQEASCISYGLFHARYTGGHKAQASYTGGRKTRGLVAFWNTLMRASEAQAGRREGLLPCADSHTDRQGQDGQVR